MIQTVLQWLFQIIGLTQRIRVLCHRALILPNGPECFFINITNISLQREVELTHVWLDYTPEIHVLNPHRVLPQCIKPGRSWETWIAVNNVPLSYHDTVFDNTLIRLSNGRIFRSRKNNHVPITGFIPGNQGG
jgi:hypothetical protein